MSSSRLLLLGSSFRTHTLLPCRPPFTSKLPPLSILSSRLYCSSAAVAAVSETNRDKPTAISSHHPWLEWVSFVDRLKAKGYFDGDNVASDVMSSEISSNLVYKDINLVKDASLSFARDRYDIFKSLSMEDMQNLVGKGCPNLFRKAVNSAKRLRAHLRLDEGDVCSACNLRGSCDRAYVTLKENEAAARTVDIMRILLFYTLDPLVVDGEENEKPPGRETVDTSARKLLTELMKLSETEPDPSLPKPAVKAKKQETVNVGGNDEMRNVEMKRGDWICPKCNFMNFAKNKKCRQCTEAGPRDVEGEIGMKQGDWICSSCNFMNFARNKTCRQCNQGAPKIVGGETEMKQGDWMCSSCNFMNFARNIRCLKCRADGPKRIDKVVVEMKKGDWNCDQCGFMNFSSNKRCRRCSEQRKRQLNPGEWECPSCDFLNFRRNSTCLKCNCERPEAAI